MSAPARRALYAFVILALAGLVLFWFRMFGGYEIVKSGAAVVSEVRALNRLETASFNIEKIIEAGTNGNVFSEFLFGDHILLVAYGEVVSGVDLSRIAAENVNVEGTRVALTLPAPEIFSVALRDDQTRVFDRKLGILTKGNKNLEAQARQAAEDVIRNAACAAGILTKASDNAKQELAGFLRALGFTAVTITVPEGTC